MEQKHKVRLTTTSTFDLERTFFYIHYPKIKEISDSYKKSNPTDEKCC